MRALVLVLIAGLILPGASYASALPYMSAPGQILEPSSYKNTPLLCGIKIYPGDPFKFDFIIDQGDNDLTQAQLKAEADRLVRYFLAGLTIPEQDLWVNLSPYEQNRIAPQALGQTDLGKDMLGLDYVLKQLAASLTYPETELGRKYWNEINNPVITREAIADCGNLKQIATPHGSSAHNDATQSFNKIWIIPESARIYQDKDKAFIMDSKLKVMMEEDYLATQKNVGVDLCVDPKQNNTINGRTRRSAPTDAFKQIILPLIQNEVNHGENFAQLRQIYNSLLLAAWFKNNLKQSIINQLYSNQKKISGVDVSDPKIKEKIYQQYREAFKQGAYNYVKKELMGTGTGSPARGSVYVPGTKIVRRQYFSGGMRLTSISQVEKDGERPSTPGVSVLRQVKRGVSATVVLATLGLACAPNLPPAQNLYYRMKADPGVRADAPWKEKFAYYGKKFAESERLFSWYVWGARFPVEDYFKVQGLSPSSDFNKVLAEVESWDDYAQIEFMAGCLKSDSADMGRIGSVLLPKLLAKQSLRPLLHATARELCATGEKWDDALYDKAELKRGNVVFNDARLEYAAKLPFWQWLFRYRQADILAVNIDLVGLGQILANDAFAQATQNLSNIHKFSLAREVSSLVVNANRSLSDAAINGAVALALENNRAVASKRVVQSGTKVNIMLHEDMATQADQLRGLLGKLSGDKAIKIYMEANGHKDGQKAQAQAGAGVVGGKAALLDLEHGAIANSPFNPANNLWWFGAHGSDDHVWFNARDIKEINPGALYANAANAKEVADALIARAAHLTGADRGRLDDTILVFDACYSADFVTNLLGYLLSAYLDGKIISWPWIVASANSKTVGHSVSVADGHGGNKLLSLLAAALSRVLASGQPFDFAALEAMKEFTQFDEDIVVFTPPANSHIEQLWQQFGGFHGVGFNSAEPNMRVRHRFVPFHDARDNQAVIMMQKASWGYGAQVFPRDSHGRGDYLGSLSMRPLSDMQSVGLASEVRSSLSRALFDRPKLRDFFLGLLQTMPKNLAPRAYVYPEKISNIFNLSVFEENIYALYQGVVGMEPKLRAVIVGYELIRNAWYHNLLDFNLRRDGDAINLEIYRGLKNKGDLVDIIKLDGQAEEFAKKIDPASLYYNYDLLMRVFQQAIYNELYNESVEKTNQLQAADNSQEALSSGVAAARADWESSLRKYLDTYFADFANKPVITFELVEELWQIHLLGGSSGYYVVDPSSNREYERWDPAEENGRSRKMVKSKDVKVNDVLRVKIGENQWRASKVVEAVGKRLIFTGLSAAVIAQKRERAEKACAKAKFPDPQAATDGLLRNGILGSVIKDGDDILDRQVGGLSLNTVNADIKLTGKADGLNLFSQTLSFDPKDFKGFTYSITRLEKLQDSADFAI